MFFTLIQLNRLVIFLMSGIGGSRQRSQCASVRHSPDLRLRGRGLHGWQPQFHRFGQLRRRPRLRLPQRLGTTFPETGQHVRPTLRWPAPPRTEAGVWDINDADHLWGEEDSGSMLKGVNKTKQTPQKNSLPFNGIFFYAESAE